MEHWAWDEHELSRLFEQGDPGFRWALVVSRGTMVFCCKTSGIDGGKGGDVRKLQLAFSKKEKGEQLLARLEELNDAGEVSEEQYTSKKEQYTQLIQEGASEIEAVRTSLATKVEALKRDLEKYPQELEDLELKSKLGEIEAESYARREQRIRAKIERIEKDLKENEDLLDAETAEDAGGFIEIKLEKRGLLRRPDWL